MRDCTLPTTNCESIDLELCASARLGKEIGPVLCGWNILDDDAFTILHSEMRAKPMIADGNVLGSWRESRRISRCQQLAGSVVLEHGAYGGNPITIRKIELAADFLQQSSHVNKAAHPSRKSNIFALRRAECN